MYARQIELCSGLTGTILNLLLIPLIITQSSPKVGRYKYLLLAYTASACYFSFCVSTCLYTWYLPNNGFVFVSTLHLFPRTVQYLQILTFVGSYVVTLTIVDLSFVYRLNCLNNSNSGMTKLCYYAILLFGIANFFGLIAIIAVFLAPHPETDALFHDDVYNGLEINLQDVGYVGGLLRNNDELNMGVLSVLYVISIFIAISAVISITCWHKIRSKLRLYKSNPNYNFHRRCYILLTLQMCVPILFSMLPIGVIVVLMGLNTPIGDLPQYCAMVFSFAQVLDPLFTILFIAEYKRFGIKVLRMLCRSQKSSPS